MEKKRMSVQIENVTAVMTPMNASMVDFGTDAAMNPLASLGPTPTLLDDNNPAVKRYKKERFQHCPGVRLTLAETQAAYASWAHTVDRTPLPSLWQLTSNPGLFTSTLSGADDLDTLFHLLEGMHISMPPSAKGFITDFYTETLRNHMPYLQFLNLLERLKFLHRLWKAQVLEGDAELSDDFLDAFASFGGEADATGSASMILLTEFVAEFGVGADEVKKFVPPNAAGAEEFAPLYDPSLRLVLPEVEGVSPNTTGTNTNSKGTAMNDTSPQSRRRSSLISPVGKKRPNGAGPNFSSALNRSISALNRSISRTSSMNNISGPPVSKSTNEGAERKHQQKGMQESVNACNVPGVDFEHFMGIARPSRGDGVPPLAPKSLEERNVHTAMNSKRVTRAHSSLADGANARSNFVFSSDVDVTIPGPGPPQINPFHPVMASSQRQRKRRQSRSIVGSLPPSFTPGLDRHNQSGRMVRTTSLRSAQESVGDESTAHKEDTGGAGGGKSGKGNHRRSLTSMESGSVNDSQEHTSHATKETQWTQAAKKLKPVGALTHPSLVDNPLMQRRMGRYTKTVRQFR